MSYFKKYRIKQSMGIKGTVFICCYPSSLLLHSQL
jgi:hypothetical protein